jgi:urease gamma subunit
MHEAARGGATYAEVEAAARNALTEQDVLEGVTELIGTIKIECLFGDGMRVLHVERPIGPPQPPPIAPQAGTRA